MNFDTQIKEKFLILDGGMGTLLQNAGLRSGEYPERWNITHSEVIKKIHEDYLAAGSNVISANTFGANCLNFSEDELELIIKAAIDNARAAIGDTDGRYVALDIGPTGRLLRPLGDFDFEDAVEVFAKTVRLGAKYGADLIIFETFSDSYETKAAVLAAKENCDLPVIVTNAYGADGKLMTGATPAAMVAMLEGLRVDAVGANCSLGPRQLEGVVDELLKNASLPVVLQPNAGLPKVVNGKTVYDVDSEEFSSYMLEFAKKGVRIVGGCCGTTPEYIEKTALKLAGITPAPSTEKNITCISSYTHALKFENKPVLIGERINPTGKKRFKQALIENDIDYILGEGINQQEKGVHVLDVNVGLPDIDEAAMLCRAVTELQAVTDLPLQIDTSNTDAMERALRLYNGKAMINSVSGKAESMDAVFPLAAKYGGLIVALTLDEEGIPPTAEGRIAIAEKILTRAGEFGIKAKDIIFDTLAMTVSADNKAALATLDALKTIKNELGCHTSLGVSNVSFGLPRREVINSTFFALALENGLSAAIMNPYSADMMKTYHAFRALHGLDENCAEFIEFAAALPDEKAQSAPAPITAEENYASELQKAVIKGLRDRASEICRALLFTTAPLDVVQNEIIPALDVVGKGFEEKKVYLPQLLMSAEAAKAAFEEVKTHMTATGSEKVSKFPVVIATVKGDIHDIGKNIVKLLLENYGFEVVDLGRDVPPEDIVATVIERNAPLVALSALMTTTVPAMEETIKQLRMSAPDCKIIVGGAVLTQEYADKIGADRYAKDAMEAVRYADSLK